MSDGASRENVQDWKAVMSDGSMDDNESEGLGDDESVPENWELNINWELNSMGADGGLYVYPPEPFIEVPTISSRTLEYYEQLFENSYDFMAYYKGEHFAWMGRIRDNLPGRPGFVQYRHPNEPVEHCMDPMLAGGMFTYRTNEEGNIMMPIRQEYDAMCLRNIYDSTTAEVFEEAVTAPVLDPEWGCDGGTPVDVEGYPLTQYYTLDNEYVLKGPALAFFPINQEIPTYMVPANLILPRWPTGPDQRIVESNPLYQYARSNVPIEDDELWAKPTHDTCVQYKFF
eukprot:scaffold33355_cov36-Attheya_sp.AAC.6